jgi:SSS family solute:Na+ symporter
MYLAVLFLYFVVLITVGIFLSKKNLDFESYFFGRRKLGKFLIFFTVTASWFGAASTLETVISSHKNGLAALWLLGFPTIITLLLFIMINKKIRRIKFVSLPAMLKTYYGNLVFKISSFLIFFYMVLLASSQLAAWGKFVGSFFNQNYELTVCLGALVIIIYSFLGGYLSVVFTDGIQFVLLTISILYLALFLNKSTLQFKPHDFDLFGQLDHNLLMTLSFVLAWLISPIIWQRIASAKSQKASRFGLLLSVGAIIILYILITLIGIGMRNFPPGENIFSSVAKNWLPTAGSLLVFLGIAAAIMSTTDTAINISALTLIKDVFQLKKQTRLLLYAKIATFTSGIFAILIALRFRSIIKTLGLASEIMAEGLFIPGMYLLIFRKKRPSAALGSLLLGGGFSILVFFNAFGLPLSLPSWPYSLPYGLSLSLLGFIIGFLIDKKSSQS